MFPGKRCNRVEEQGINIHQLKAETGGTEREDGEDHP